MLQQVRAVSMQCAAAAGRARAVRSTCDEIKLLRVIWTCGELKILEISRQKCDMRSSEQTYSFWHTAYSCSQNEPSQHEIQWLMGLRASVLKVHVLYMYMYQKRTADAQEPKMQTQSAHRRLTHSRFQPYFSQDYRRILLDLLARDMGE